MTLKADPAAGWQVVIQRPLPAYDFGAPHGWDEDVPVGCRVMVPWRGELVMGLVVGPTGQPGGHRLREVVAVLDSPVRPWVQPAVVRALTGWATDYQIPAGLLWSDLLGAGWSTDHLRHLVRAIPGTDLSAFGESSLVPAHEWQPAGQFEPALLDAVREQGLLDEELLPVPRTRPAVEAVAWREVPAASSHQSALQVRPDWSGTLTAKGQQAWNWLQQHGPQTSAGAWAKGAGVSQSVVQTVMRAGAVQETEVAVYPPAWQWLQQRGPQPSVSAWAQGAGVSASAATGLLARGWARLTEQPAPPPELPAPGAPWLPPECCSARWPHCRRALANQRRQGPSPLGQPGAATGAHLASWRQRAGAGP
ncbi:hypothetical protein ACFP81_08930 [Deinococcus lacus]|uniref:Primosomal protein N' 3' DNA-binding domain-containing protein n=1 Tax=Deinococcus lacus TaxID=392561 RepID=A0ABW1YDK5_9DEIO